MKSFLVVVSLMLLSPPGVLAQSPDTDFTIVLSQSTPEGIVAAITTTAAYSCAGCRLQARLPSSHDTTTIHSGGVMRPSHCFTTFDVGDRVGFSARSERRKAHSDCRLSRTTRRARAARCSWPLVSLNNQTTLYPSTGNV